MPEPTPRHFSMPFRFERGRDGRATVRTTEQGSPEEIADCVECCVRTVVSERSTLPNFGRPEQLEFSTSAELARSQLQIAIDEAEPRARAVVEGDFDPTDPAVLRLRAMFELMEAQ